MEEEIILERKYSIADEMFEKAFDAYQKKFVYPKNIIISAILMAAAVINIADVLKGNGTVAGYILITVCMALSAINLYNPRKIKNNLMAAVKKLDSEDVYRLKILPEKLIIGTVTQLPENEKDKPKEEYEEVFEDTQEYEKISDTEIYFANNVLVMDKPDFFIVYLKKSIFYVIPKKDFSDEEITVMQIHFQKQLGKNYIKYEK